MWKFSDIVRTPNQKTISTVDPEMITWSVNKVGSRDLVLADCFPVTACLADDVTILEAGTVIQLYGSIKSDLEILHVVRVEEIHNFVSSRSRAPSRFKSREISTINEEEENLTFGHDLYLKVTPGGDDNDDDDYHDNDVLICSYIVEGCLQPGEVLMMPCKLRPKFRLPLKPPTMPDYAWDELLDSFTRSTNLVDLDVYIKKLASRPSYDLHLNPDIRQTTNKSNDNFGDLKNYNNSSRLPDELEIEKRESVKTLLPGIKSFESQNKLSLGRRGVRKIKSMLSVYEGAEVDADQSRSTNNGSCSDIHRSILSLFSSSNLNLSSDMRGSEFLNELRPMNYKRQTSEPVKTKSRFSIFRAKKSKKSKQIDDQPEETRNIQSEIEKTKRYVDLLDIVGKPKSSNRSVMGSILNLTDLGNSLHDISSTKHLSMPCDIGRIRPITNLPQPSSKPLALERYFINKQRDDHLTSTDAIIIRKKQMKTNLRIMNKFGSQVIPSADQNTDECRRSLYPEDFSKSVENVECLKDFNAGHKDRSCQRLGISMFGAKINPKTSKHDANQVQNISQLSINEPPLHFHSIIRTNPHMNRKQQKCNHKQFSSKSTLSTDDDFQFVRLVSIRKTSEASHNNIDNNTNLSNNEVIYENINFISDTSPQDSLIPVESLNSRTNSTESSDCINSDTSFGGLNDHSSPHPRLGCKYPQRKTPHRTHDDDGYQSSFDNFNVDNFARNYHFVSEVISYL